MNDTYNNYSADYRNLYDKEESSITIKGVCLLDEKKIEERHEVVEKKEESSKNFIKENKVKNKASKRFAEKNKNSDESSSNRIEDDNIDELILEMLKLIKISGRILGTMFIILLCVGIAVFTVNFVNNSCEEEKIHFPYTLMCMLKNGNNR